MKKWVKVILWILGAGIGLLLIAFLYFWFLFQMPLSAMCVSSTNITRSEITCNSDLPCQALFKEDVKKELGTLEGVPPEFVERILNNLIDASASCNNVCELRNSYVLESVDDSCLSGDNKIVINLKGSEFAKIAKQSI